MNAYYDELHASGDPTRAAGWRHRIEQAMRFEVALELAPSPLGDVLDLGCAAAALRDYIDATGRLRGHYVGVDLFPAATALASSSGRPGDELHVGDLHDPTLGLPVVDSVFAIGAAVDGVARADDVARITHVMGLVRRAASYTRDYLCVVVLDQRALMARPGLAAEPALLGAHPHELASIAAQILPGWSWRVRDDFAPSDLAVLARRDVELGSVRRWDAHHAALAGPWGEGLSARERAWLWFVSGELDAAESSCREACGRGDARAELLMERIEAAR